MSAVEYSDSDLPKAEKSRPLSQPTGSMIAHFCALTFGAIGWAYALIILFARPLFGGISSLDTALALWGIAAVIYVCFMPRATVATSLIGIADKRRLYRAEFWFERLSIGALLAGAAYTALGVYNQSSRIGLGDAVRSNATSIVLLLGAFPVVAINRAVAYNGLRRVPAAVFCRAIDTVTVGAGIGVMLLSVPTMILSVIAAKYIRSYHPQPSANDLTDHRVFIAAGVGVAIVALWRYPTFTRAAATTSLWMAGLVPRMIGGVHKVGTVVALSIAALAQIIFLMVGMALFYGLGQFADSIAVQSGLEVLHLLAWFFYFCILGCFLGITGNLLNVFGLIRPTRAHLNEDQLLNPGPSPDGSRHF